MLWWIEQPPGRDEPEHDERLSPQDKDQAGPRPQDDLALRYNRGCPVRPRDEPEEGRAGEKEGPAEKERHRNPLPRTQMPLIEADHCAHEQENGSDNKCSARRATGDRAPALGAVSRAAYGPT